MTDLRNPDNTAIRHLSDQLAVTQARFEQLDSYIRDHCRNEENTNKALLEAIQSINKKQDGMGSKQGEFERDIDVMQRDLSDIKDVLKEDLKPLVTTVAVHDKDLTDAEGDIQNIYKMISEDRKERRAQPVTEKK